MASNQTANFGLNQWSAEDRVMREEFNADNAKIDAALGLCGNCRIVTGIYTGSGKFGASNPVTLTFEGTPLLLFVSAEGTGACMWCGRGQTLPNVTNGSTAVNCAHMTWHDNGVSWYNGDHAVPQMNDSGKTYRFMALIDTKE